MWMKILRKILGLRMYERYCRRIVWVFKMRRVEENIIPQNVWEELCTRKEKKKK